MGRAAGGKIAGKVLLPALAVLMSGGPAPAAVPGGLGTHATLQALSGSAREQGMRRDAHRRYLPAEGARPYIGYGAGALSDRTGLFEGDTLFSPQVRAGAAAGDWDAGLALPFRVLVREAGEGRTGWGSVRLHAGYELVPQYEQRPALYGAALGTIPTASGSSVQSGEPMGGGLFEMSRSWPGYQGSLVAGLLQVGDPQTTDYDEVFFYSVRASERRPFGRIYGSVDRRTGYRPGVAEATEIRGGILYRLDNQRMVTGEAFLGFSSGSPRIGMRVGILRWL